MKNLVLFVLLLFSMPAFSQEKFIDVTGTSELQVYADQMKFNVQIKAVEESLEASKNAADQYLDQLLGLLKDEKISSDDINVSPLTFGKNYNYSEGKRIQNGFFTNVNLSFLLKDLKKYYGLTNKLSKNENYELSAAYELSDYEKQNRKAYEQALLAAKEKAVYMCSTLEVACGDVLEIDATGNTQHYPNPFNVSTKENYEPDNFSGTVTIRKSVRVKFGIK